MKFITSILSIFVFAAFIGCSAKSDIGDNKDIVIIGHGGSGFETFFSQLPANTLASFDKAIMDDEADGIEMDIQLSKDDVVVIFHDKILDNKTDLKGLVREQLVADLNKCDFHGDFSMFSKGKHSISSLEQILTHFNEFLHTKYFYFNIKLEVDPEREKYAQVISEQLVKIINEFDIKKTAIVETSDIRVLNQIQLLDSSIIVMQDIGAFENDFKYVLSNNFNGLVVANKNITAEQVLLAKKAGKKVVIYGERTRGGLKEVLDKDPDVIQTDKIDLTKRLAD
ncbi:MAG: hypothetical protein IPI31_06345 [Bacteroidetes bacterium]|nr:hypothetical protein [Bacteroidota bacterium]MBP8915886.1 hypothetical protein [Chitinophagales bacterium]MBP9796571.1 hypothetical protein [Chitinophagales bacterium]